MKPVRTVLLFAALGLAACSKPSTGEQAGAKTEGSAKAAASASVATKTSASASGSADTTAMPMPSGSALESSFSVRKATGLAANETSVAGYPDEKKIDPPVKKKIAAAYYTARVEAKGTGKSVAVLPKDAEVTVVAERGTHALITFANPNKSTETLAGWIFKIAFDASALARCPSPGLMVDAPSTGAFCAKPCAPDKACAAGQKCNHGACMPSGD